MDICSSLTCHKHVHAKGFCQAHYRLLKKYGVPEPKRKRLPVCACKVEGCESAGLSKIGGYCHPHYYRLKRYGTPHFKRQTSAELANAAMSITTEDCVIWPMAKNRDGYGRVRLNGISMPAHRAVCILAHGEPPSPSHQAAHSCGNPSCYNPKHIRWATARANTKDKFRHGTILRGESHPLARMSEEQARRCFHIWSNGETIANAAKAVGCTYGAAFMLCTGKTWKHISSSASSPSV